jgi:hypothetical protein
VAIAAHLEDNPGSSVVNDAERLHEDIARAFDADPAALRLICYLPAFGRGEDRFTELILGAEPPFRRLERVELEMLVGTDLPHLSDEQATIAALGRPDHPALDLVEPPERERDAAEDLTVVAVADLPFAHNPFRCPHGKRYEQILATYPDSWSSHAPAGAQFFLSLADDDFTACEFHAADWAAVGAASVELLARLQRGDGREAVEQLADQLLASEPERGWLVSLFRDPIHYSAGADRVGNGQHRACALRASGAPCAVVDTQLRGEPQPRDVRGAARAALAVYWADAILRP